MSKMSAEIEELRDRKVEVESLLKTFQSDLDAMRHANEDLNVKVVEKERQVKEVTTQVQSMQVRTNGGYI
jgi:predicted  nucleic acid-binding Zn-ribbon protein